MSRIKSAPLTQRAEYERGSLQVGVQAGELTP